MCRRAFNFRAEKKDNSREQLELRADLPRASESKRDNSLHRIDPSIAALRDTA
jgi:hypothetical protein